MEDKKNQKLAWGLLIILSIIWGASYLLIKLALHDLDGNVRLLPDQLGAVRMVIASAVLLPFFFKLRKTIQKKHIIFIIISGVFGNGLPALLFAYAQMNLDSSITGMLNSLVPIFAILIAVFVFGFHIKWNHLTGIVVGVTGAVLIVYSKLQHVVITTNEVVPFLLVIAATLCYAISLNVIKYKLVELKPMAITSAAFLAAGIPCLIYLLSTGFVSHLATQKNILEGIAVVGVLSIVGTAIAVYLFNHLIKISTPIFASSVTYFIPVVATLLGFLVSEELTFFQIIGMIVLILGVLLINRSSTKSVKTKQ